MTCYHPSSVIIGRKSLARVGFHVQERVTVPCGHCLGCRTDQARGWAVRLVHEGMTSATAWFVTLTYRPEELPQWGSLFPRDFTLFTKKLRRSENDFGRRFSYYVAGEYGDDTARPHYHAALFGPEFLDKEQILERNGAPVFTSETLQTTWGHGLCEMTGLTYAAARYCASYVRKKVRRQDHPDHYVRVDPASGELVEIEREYGRMSRNPALGRRWIEQFWEDAYPRDFVVMDGRPLKPPRYYDKWMENFQPAVMLAVKEQRLKDIVEIGDEKLIMKEKIHRAKVNLFQGRAAI